MKLLPKSGLAFLLAFVLLFGSTPLSFVAPAPLATRAMAYTDGIYTFKTESGEAVITKCDTSASGEAVIPSTLGGCPVTGIGAEAFKGCIGLTAVTIPESIRSVDNNAFFGCAALETVNFKAVNCEVMETYDYSTYEYNSVFVGCAALKTLNIGPGVFRLPNYAFYGCPGLETINIPDNVTSIGYAALDATAWYAGQPEGPVYAGKVFYTYKGLMPPDTVFVLNPDTKGIADYALYNRAGLAEITIPADVIHIGIGAFSQCENFTVMRFNATDCAAVGSSAYTGSALRTLVIGDNVLSIPDNAFTNTGLKDVTVGGAVLSIGSNAFARCPELTQLTLPSSVRSVGKEAFRASGLTEIVIPDGVTAIGDKAFYDCSKLASAALPASVEAIGFCAFSRCDVLTEITVNALNDEYTSVDGVLFNKTKTDLIQYPCGVSGSYTVAGSVETIHSEAFYRCAGLTGVVFPTGLTSIGDWAFFGCSGLTNISIPAGMTRIGNHAFANCAGLRFVSSEAGSAAAAGTGGVTGIGDWAFDSCGQLESVTIGPGLTSIGEGAFFGCSGLASVSVPAGMTKIGNYAFSYCMSLGGLTLPAAVSDIGDAVFEGCENLTVNCLQGSRAEMYAYDAGIPFESVEDIRPKGSAIVDKPNGILYGIEEAAASLNSFIDTPAGAELQITLSADNICGTGTAVSLVFHGGVLKTYTVVLFGDVNGDAVINAIDSDICVLVQNWMVAWDPGAQSYLYTAGDVNGDGRVDSIDADLVNLHENWILTIDQTTGRPAEG